VVGTTVFFGSAMPLVQKLLVPPIESEKFEYNFVVEEEHEEGGGTRESQGKINSTTGK
jgi:hypothetical protein